MDSRQTIIEYIKPSSKRKITLWVLAILALVTLVAGSCLYYLTSLSTIGGLAMMAGVLILATWGCLVPSYSSGNKNMKYTLNRLEELGLLDSAAAELNGEDKLVVADDRSRLTPNFAFRRHAGVVVAFEDIVWLKIYPGRSQDIEISTNIRTGRSFNPVSLFNKNSNYGEIDRAYKYLSSRCPNALNGYSEDNASAYRAVVKEYKAAAKAAKKN